MKQTDVGGTEGGNFKITFDYIYQFFLKTYFKNVSKMCSANYEFNIPDLLCLKPLQGSHYSLLPSISKHLEIHYTIHTLKMSLYASLCNNTVVMWPLFIEVIVSFCVKITQGKFM